MKLTDEELGLVVNQPLLRAKSSATATLKGHLEALKWALFPEVQAGYGGWVAPEGFEPTSSQIARGENLDGTPYQYLDYPRYFTKPCYFAFRSLIWWGRAVCFCWILKGPDLPHYRRALIGGGVTPVPHMGAWFGGDPWDWDGFVPLDSVPPEALAPMEFLKVGRRIPLSRELLERDRFVEEGLATFRALQTVLARP